MAALRSRSIRRMSSPEKLPPELRPTLATVGRLVARAREEQVPVVWVQHEGEGLERDSEAWQIVAELAPGEGEPLVEKRYGDAFEDTTLEQVLAGMGVGRLVVVASSVGIRSMKTRECAEVRIPFVS